MGLRGLAEASEISRSKLFSSIGCAFFSVSFIRGTLECLCAIIHLSIPRLLFYSLFQPAPTTAGHRVPAFLLFHSAVFSAHLKEKRLEYLVVLYSIVVDRKTVALLCMCI